MRLEVDPELVIPDEDLTLAEGAIAPWAMGSADRHQEVMAGLSEELSFSMDTPWRALPERAREALLHGKDYKRSEEHASELQSRGQLVCRLLLEKQKIQ